ncbi:transposase [Paenibacillus albus]|uniref:Transposase n=1 Tax=Paenibacillus albus TaxID=2495582 RepID=A0A3S9A1A8_9BACL|nr:transposase [Paenibacillus albus]AZN39434.1 transposase [Paenibacillus albus]
MDEQLGHNQMDPVSGEPVEVDGVYTNELGREEHLKRGDVFPADPQIGTTEWELTQLAFDNHHEGKTDERLTPKKEITQHEAHLQHPRRHPDDVDK